MAVQKKQQKKKTKWGGIEGRTLKCLGALVRFKVPQLDGGVGRARRCNAYARVCVCVHLCICLFVCLCACLVVGCKDKHKPAFPCLGSLTKHGSIFVKGQVVHCFCVAL